MRLRSLTLLVSALDNARAGTSEALVTRPVAAAAVAESARRAWLVPRAGKLMAAPKKLGSRAHKAMAKAPGTYVMAS